ncbi:hypothetical protein A3C23_02085 [Candidatus Roizmanbacteria bacterium RIFCSPHIGHO2_02_FULL_37_13b]|uniref:Translation elongation factor-like protein n=1 Tax=Candidatus Roizmanbacteria bacterium RIFCSPLOWO2_02_FULL_36_11 TaxID=1802071 RepID=A0A1F7JGN2_9BACT|nr:MAG: hypothetical protein A3C23_02085 [Candidatus Roizmanbacteria bacterium RIFCSPHIGHO2_02_FULL_37_13b]OGK54779.1 MAG: hypothetical protein A3H78_05845 [Candidatus Roizmanbacteria bacterium RIFCSPLOWO2_02_FULL_36_11]
MDEKVKKLGKVTHYFPHVNAGIIKLESPLKTGDTIRIKGNEYEFTQKVTSMQVDHKAITEAKKGDEIGVQVDQKVHEGDEVYLL